MRAIDLYSGVGGWSLGLALAGIDVVASYERYEPANETNRKNNRHAAITADIRSLDLKDLPENIDLVVGSPPCTQFSYSNRGGSGDLADGLKDIRCFLSIVDYLKPKFWAMENVPRTAEIITRELQPGGKLEDFAHLQAKVSVLNMAEWGLPQRRKRCIVGNFDFDLLASYKQDAGTRTLGDVVVALAEEVVTDPIFGIVMPKDQLIDHIKEEPLNDEEARVNCAAKVAHPVYNAMSFPDPLDKSARTITATCTRVSRESLVIADPSQGGQLRRLTLRERAVLQGFPINFQFFGSSHGQKATMIGNAVPPAFSYFVANACLERASDEVATLRSAICRFVPPDEAPTRTRVDLAGGRYRSDRTFRFAVPGFNFKSGVRLELSNKKRGAVPSWGLTFFFGSSQSIQELVLDKRVFGAVVGFLPRSERAKVNEVAAQLKRQTKAADIKRMQDVWTRRGPGGTRPFDFLDALADSGKDFQTALSSLPVSDHVTLLARALYAEYGTSGAELCGLSKLERYASPVLASVLVGAVVNEALSVEATAHSRTSRRVTRATA